MKTIEIIISRRFSNREEVFTQVVEHSINRSVHLFE
jgi:hypothetical protein